MSGEVIKSFASPSTAPRGLAFDGKYLWHCDSAAYLIYQLNLDGKIIKSFASPSSNPSGLAFDGKYLWHCDLFSDKIYQIAV